MLKKETKPNKQKKTDEEVVVNRVELSKLIDEVERLKAVADKGRLSKYDARFFKKGPNLFTLSVYNGKIIVGWKTLKDISYKDPGSGRLVEEQNYEFTFHDGNTLTVRGYEQFTDVRFTERVQVEEVSRAQDEEGTIINVKIVDPDSQFYGQELKLDARFLN